MIWVFLSEEQGNHEKVSDDLYMIICEAIPAAVNFYAGIELQSIQFAYHLYISLKG